MTNFRSFLGALLIIIVLGSCDQQSEKIPSYLYIDKFTFNVKPGEGSAHQNLMDAWVYVNGNYYGAYELPAWIPVLEEGNSNLRISPGYRQDGMLTNTFQYALLNPYFDTITLTPGHTDTIRPVSSYQDDLVFSIIEDFDGNHSFKTERDGDLDTYVQLSNQADALEGANSGLIELTSAHPYLKAESRTDLKIPQSVDPIILELSYKADIPFVIGFLGNKEFRGEQDLIDAYILPKKEWTKIYFDFRSIINESNSDYYHLAIQANFRTDSTQTMQRILIDNIKVIHR